MKRTFVPFVNSTANDDNVFLRAPRLPSSNTTAVHYGMSFLFIKTAPTVTTYLLRGVITADIEFFSYDGNNGVAYKPDP